MHLGKKGLGGLVAGTRTSDFQSDELPLNLYNLPFHKNHIFPHGIATTLALGGGVH
jgi:hypothetical protein